MKETSDCTPGDLVRSAAFLRREFLGRSVFDKDAQFSGEKTLIFYDTDIIVTYCEPWQQKSSPGEIFPDLRTQSGTSIAESKYHDIAEILASYCLISARSSSIPIYQFQEHFDETVNIYNNAEYFARREDSRLDAPAKEIDNRIRNATAFLASHNSFESGSERILPIVKYLLEQMAGSIGHPKTSRERRLRAWERFVRLTASSGGIYPAKYAYDHLNDLLPDDVSKALLLLKGEKSEDEARIGSKLEDEFHKRLGKGVRQTADAKAISTLYLLNLRLERLGWRAIFVTGARSLVEACYEPLPNFGAQSGRVSEGFSEKYVRHFWAYTTEALIEPDVDGRQRFINWLDGLLARWSDPTRFNVQGLTELINGEDGEKLLDRNEAVLASEEWESLVMNAISKHKFESLGLSSDSALKLQSRMLAKISDLRDSDRIHSWSEVVAELKEEYHREKDRHFLELSGIGKSAVWRTSGLGQRNPPDLSFSTLRNTNAIFRKLCHPVAYDPIEFRKDYTAIKFDCHDSEADGDDRQESHLKFLVLGAAFAGANKWGVALSQGKRAISIIDRSRKSGFWPIPTASGETYMSGREAYFLCACAMRMISRTEHELENSRRYLAESEYALEEDWEKGTAKRTTRTRLKCEILAIELSRYYLRREMDENDFCDDLIPDIFSAVSSLLEEIKLHEPTGAGFTSEGNFKSSFGKVTLLNVSTNIIQVAIISAFRRLRERPEVGVFPLSVANVEVALQLMCYFAARPRTSKHRVKETALVCLYRDAGARLLGNEKVGYYKSEREKEEVYSHLVDMLVTTYDAWRFKKLEDFARELNSMSVSERRSLVFLQKK